jgi:hypothetical protein
MINHPPRPDMGVRDRTIHSNDSQDSAAKPMATPVPMAELLEASKTATHGTILVRQPGGKVSLAGPPSAVPFYVATAGIVIAAASWLAMHYQHETPVHARPFELTDEDVQMPHTKESIAEACNTLAELFAPSDCKAFMSSRWEQTPPQVARNVRLEVLRNPSTESLPRANDLASMSGAASITLSRQCPCAHTLPSRSADLPKRAAVPSRQSDGTFEWLVIACPTSSSAPAMTAAPGAGSPRALCMVL